MSVIDSKRPAYVWRNAIWLVLPLLAVTLLYWPTSRSIARLWADVDNHDYGHGWLITAVCLWLVFDTGKQIASVSLRPSLAGAACLSLLSFVWLLACQMNIQTAQQLVLPLLGLAALWTFFGFVTMRQCLIAVVYVFFAMPIWDYINPIFQWTTVFAERGLLRLAGISAYFEANKVHLPSGVFAIEGPCSGLHFAIVALAIAVLYGYLNRIKNFIGLLAMALALAVLANWIRVFVIIMAGYLTNMQHYLVRVEHIRFGWAVFAPMIWIFFVIAAKMEVRAAATLPLGTEVPLADSSVNPKSNSKLAIACLCLVIVPLWYVAIAYRGLPTIGAFPALPLTEWTTAASASTSNWHPIFQAADASTQVTLRSQDRQVEFFHAVYANQTQDKKPAYHGNSAIGAWSGSVAATAKVTSIAASGRNFLETDLVDSQERHFLVWQGYYVGQRWFDNPLQAQVWYGWKSLLTNDISGVMVFRAACDANCDAARAYLTTLAMRMPQMQVLNSVHD
jgi:exosortase